MCCQGQHSAAYLELLCSLVCLETLLGDLEHTYIQ
ncbi:hypothetical protein GLYMA_03G000950v4 [Glycine max]|nr:hypothetical protein GLYMA_03G000950v4 [Glycine max]KAH1067952.1 hypothetical protein GYH30_005802 [Glycine max]